MSIPAANDPLEAFGAVLRQRVGGEADAWLDDLPDLIAAVTAEWDLIVTGTARDVDQFGMTIPATRGDDRVLVRLGYPEAFMLYMATVMTVPMVAWMRHRGHSWQLSWEMTAAMVIPGFALLCLYWMGVTTGPACSLYCALMVPAMLLVMVFRRDEYEGHATHAS